VSCKKRNIAGYGLLVIILAGAFYAYDNEYLDPFLNPEPPV